MKNNTWNREFPDVPDTVHQSVLRTLAALEDQEDKKVKKGKKETKAIKKRTMIILAAVIAGALGMSVAASGIFKWNEQAEAVFEAEPEVQNELTMEDIAREEYQTVEENGLTISAVQTIQDSNCFYALFEITAEDGGIQIDENCSMDYTISFPEGEDPFVARGWNFVDNSRQEESNSRYFEIFGTKMSAEEYFEIYGKEMPDKESDLRMEITFTGLRGAGEKATEGQLLLEGEWPFSLMVHPAEVVCYDVNREFEMEGCKVKVRSVEFSPLTMLLICEEEGIRELEKKEGISLDQLDALQAMRMRGIKYQDGSVLEEEFYNELRESCGEGSYEKLIRFSKVIEPEEVGAILLGENKTEITVR